MTDYTVAFDIDGTLRKYTQEGTYPNERIRTLCITFCSLKNVKVVAWSKRGKEYATEVVKDLGLSAYISEIYTKGDIQVDIAFDDEHVFSLGKINLIVNEISREKTPKIKSDGWAVT